MLSIPKLPKIISRTDLTPGLIEDLDIFRIESPQIPLRSQLTNIIQLAESIREKGLLQPILVRPRHNDYFEIVAGNRRFGACRSLGWRKIPCHIVELDDREAFEISLIENLQRKTLNPMEEAEAFRKYVSDFGWGGVSELARRIGRSQEYVTKRIKLLDLPKEIQEHVIRRRINTSMAEELAYVKDKEEQSKLAQLVAKRHITVRKFRDIARTNNSQIEDVSVDSVNKNPASAFDKAIITLKLALNRLCDIIKWVEDDWLMQESLLQHRNFIHSQIDLLIKSKKKYSKLAHRS